MKIRYFQNTDAESLLQLWNRAHPRYPLTAQLMAKKIFLDPNFTEKDLLVLEEKQTPIGFAYLPRQRVAVDKKQAPDTTKGYIAYFAICPEANFETAGSFLLQACEAHHQNEKCGRIGTDYAPLYHLQGFSVQADMPYITLFRSFGYESYESYRRRIDLVTYRLPEDFEQRKNALAKEGVQIGALPETFLSEFLSAENSFSNSYWAWEYGVKFAADPDLTKPRVAIQNGRLIGGCMFGDPNSDEGRFGPFGMSPDSRGRGIGSLLFADCLNEMKKRGIPSAWAQWTPLTGAANTLYNKAGFLMEDCFVTFCKEWK